jgi:hypothetical protein
MVQIVLIDKSGSVKDVNIASFDESKLYKKAGFKSNEGFTQRTAWDCINKSTVCVYGKIDGRAGQENKYELPPPIDKLLLFGTCVIVCKDADGNAIPFNCKMWNILYERLFGGFDDIGKDDSNDENEEDADGEEAELPKTKNGYAKDGFVVDEEEEDEGGEDEDEDEDEDEGGDDEDEEEEEDEEDVPKKRVQPKRVAKTKADVFTNISNDTYYTCENELSEEEYI